VPDARDPEEDLQGRLHHQLTGIEVRRRPTVTRLLLNDELPDAQLVRAVGVAGYGGSDLGECLATARRIDERDLDSWFAQWTATAPRAASQEHRLAACVADCGAYDLYAAFLDRLPAPLANPRVINRRRVRLALARLLELDDRLRPRGRLISQTSEHRRMTCQRSTVCA